MTEALLDECHKSILRIAETQHPAGRRAILMLAEMFRENFDNKRLSPVFIVSRRAQDHSRADTTRD
jgi:hypothetical protein